MAILTPPPSPFSPSQPTLPSLPSRLRAIRSRLADSDTYLGCCSIRESVTWMKFGSADKVTLVPSKSLSSVPAPESTSASPSPPPESPPEAATLSAVVLISSEDFWMTADGGYRGPGQYIRNFASIKPTCSGGVPDIEPFKSDFPEVITNVRWLLDSIATKGFSLKRGFITGPTESPRIKPKDSTDDSDNDKGGADNKEIDTAGDVFKIENWPVHTEAARSELHAMVGSHQVVPIPAYDMHGHLIHPMYYRNRLLGAVAELNFELTHWSMRGKKDEPGCDAYTADLVAIRVLVPPKPTLVTPKKRKVHHRMDPLESPSPMKKRRICTV